MSGGTIQWRAATTVDLSGVTGGLTFTGGTFDTNGNAVTFASPINPGTGTLTLKSTRDVRWDLMVEDFNCQEPRPAALKKMLEMPK
jgi:hypothetical protein